MPITNIRIRNVGLFENVEFSFDPQVNVFVGPNNCGKTTALFTLADIAVNPFTFPQKHIHKDSKFLVQANGTKEKKGSIEGPLPISVGGKGYWNDERIATLYALQKQLGYSIFIPALRVGTDFRSKGPTVKSERRRQRAVQLEMARLTIEEGTPREPQLEIGSSFIRDESIIEDLIALDYQAYRQDNPAIRKTIERIASIGSRITEGFPVKFAGVDEDDHGLYPCFKTPDGKMPLNVLSQGTQGLLLWLARFIIGYSRYYEFPESFENKPGVLIIDEIDAHLHPSWQRRILPELTAEFPALQIFCSTHSPLMIAGLKRGQVQLLQRDKHGKVRVSQNETDVKGWSADEIYSCFLGVENPTDLQTDTALERLEELRGKKRTSSQEKREMEKLRSKVGSALRGAPFFQRSVDDMVQQLDSAAREVVAKTKGSRVKA